MPARPAAAQRIRQWSLKNLRPDLAHQEEGEEDGGGQWSPSASRAVVVLDALVLRHSGGDAMPRLGAGSGGPTATRPPGCIGSGLGPHIAGHDEAALQSYYDVSARLHWPHADRPNFKAFRRQPGSAAPYYSREGSRHAAPAPSASVAKQHPGQAHAGSLRYCAVTSGLQSRELELELEEEDSRHDVQDTDAALRAAPAKATPAAEVLRAISGAESKPPMQTHGAFHDEEDGGKAPAHAVPVGGSRRRRGVSVSVGVTAAPVARRGRRSSSRMPASVLAVGQEAGHGAGAGTHFEDDEDDEVVGGGGAAAPPAPKRARRGVSESAPRLVTSGVSARSRRRSRR